MNASGSEFSPATASAFFVKPVRNASVTSNVLAYTNDGEIVDNSSITIDGSGIVNINGSLTVNGSAVGGGGGTPKLYPPAPFTQDGLNSLTKSQTYNGYTHGNGTYNIRVSSSLGTGSDAEVMLDDGVNYVVANQNAWHTNWYNATNQYFIIELPDTIEPVYYKLVNRTIPSQYWIDSYNPNMPRDWRFEGSNDYNHSTNSGTWTVIHRVNDAKFRDHDDIDYHVNTYGKTYKAFRWWWYRTNETNGALMVIKELLLFGRNEGT